MRLLNYAVWLNNCYNYRKFSAYWNTNSALEHHRTKIWFLTGEFETLLYYALLCFAMLYYGHSNKRISKSVQGISLEFGNWTPAHWSTINPTAHRGGMRAKEVNSHVENIPEPYKDKTTRQSLHKNQCSWPGSSALGQNRVGTRSKQHFCTISAPFMFFPGLNYTVWLSPERRFIMPMALKASSFSGSRLQLLDGLIEAKKPKWGKI